MLPELADLGQLFKITHWHRKGGTRGNEVCPHAAQGTAPSLYKCRALTQSLQTKCLFQREPFAAVQGLAAGSSARSSPGRARCPWQWQSVCSRQDQFGQGQGQAGCQGMGHREGVSQGEASRVLQQAGREAIRAIHAINTPGG